MTVDVDVIVVGAGAGGGTLAAHAAEAGLSVLLLERGQQVDPRRVPRDHLRNHVSARYRNALNPAPGAHPRVLIDDEGRRHIVSPPNWLHNNTANAVGGGTLVWSMQAWRYHPDDFRMASRYGVPDGSSLADWPIGYDTLEPYYTRAERELGVAAAPVPYAPRSEPPSREPLPPSPVDRWLVEGAARRDWSTFRVPLAIDTNACIRCAECVGFSCPVDAKHGSHNRMLPRALATGVCRLEAEAQVTRITTDGSGRTTGVEYLMKRERRVVRARAVVVAAGAIETARLLLLSGLGNEHDHVGRHLQGHTYPVAVGVLPSGLRATDEGPGIGIATDAVVHGNPGVIGGAMLANDYVKTPLMFWEFMLPPETPRWGAANKTAMRELFGRAIDIRGPVHEVPSPASRVRLAPDVRDAAGVSVAELSGGIHPETIRTAELVQREAARWLEASGAERVWTLPIRRGMTVAHHQAGTCRMSSDPADGVTDTTGRVHGHDNLFVADASVHVTNGSFNPTLTTMALAMRTADEVIAQHA